MRPGGPKAKANHDLTIRVSVVPAPDAGERLRKLATLLLIPPAIEKEEGTGPSDGYL